MMSLRSPLLPVLLGSLLCGVSEAQRMHVSGLIGENPDTNSNWPHPAAPDGNPYVRSTASPGEIAQRTRQEILGKLLFWEEQVSSDNSMACGTCHFMSSGGTDGRPGGMSPLHPLRVGSFGMIDQAREIPGALGATPLAYAAGATPQVTDRHTPTMIGAYMFEKLFWKATAGPGFELEDGSGNVPGGFDDWAALEDLAVVPPTSPIEMGHQGVLWSDGFIQAKLGESLPMALVVPSTIPPNVMGYVNSGLNYDQIFDNVFANHSNPALQSAQGVTRARFGAAVAHYLRTLIPDEAPIDTPGGMTADMIAGFNILGDSQNNCFACHSATGSPSLDPVTGMLMDPFDNLFSSGLQDDNAMGGQGMAGMGTGQSKITTLRNMGLRKRFFSHGQSVRGDHSIDTLITFYDEEADAMNNILGAATDLTPTQFMQVKAFLVDALTDPRVANETFPFDRPTLASEGPDYTPFGSNKYGSATAGASGTTPEIIANSVPYITPGTVDWFKLGLAEAAPNRPARLFVSATPGVGPLRYVGIPLTAIVNTSTNGQGAATVHNPIALTPGIVGMTLFAQWQVVEVGSNSFSNAAHFTPVL